MSHETGTVQGSESSEDSTKDAPTDTSDVERRAFLKAGIGALGATMAVGYSIPAVRAATANLSEGGDDGDWLTLGPTSSIPAGDPTFFQVEVEDKTGWLDDRRSLGVFVVTDDGEDFVAMSDICTHLGCKVRWLPDDQMYLSPCHIGLYDRLGGNISGPPPRPLDRYEVRIVDGQVQIDGIPHRQEPA